ncbi:MAG: aminoglycoside phosphotransferase family protein [Xenococcaceae cyanobacterium MO_167.B27]|nr:aminoglycoside phosphotransferase family protein [Xenococcaceae cyanobacterium MO_167.B27]
MKYSDIWRGFGITIEGEPSLESLYAYAPVYRFSYGDRDWVLKPTRVRSDGDAIAAWTSYLVFQGIGSVAPTRNFGKNPRSFPSGKNDTEENWIIYPFITGIPYRGNTTQIRFAGKLLGEIHSQGMNTDFNLKVSKTVVAIEAKEMEEDIQIILQEIEKSAPENLNNAQNILTSYSQRYLEEALPKLLKISLPLTNCSWDYKAANLIYKNDTSPILVDPDHGGRIPRMYDLATALLLFHCDIPSAPKRMFTPTEWIGFLEGYTQYIQPTLEEQQTWNDLLLCAWMDQVLWLLSHFPEGWKDANESRYLLSLLTTNLVDFSLLKLLQK